MLRVRGHRVRDFPSGCCGRFGAGSGGRRREWCGRSWGRWVCRSGAHPTRSRRKTFSVNPGTGSYSLSVVRPLSDPGRGSWPRGSQLAARSNGCAEMSLCCVCATGLRAGLHQHYWTLRSLGQRLHRRKLFSPTGGRPSDRRTAGTRRWQRGRAYYCVGRSYCVEGVPGAVPRKPCHGRRRRRYCDPGRRSANLNNRPTGIGGPP